MGLRAGGDYSSVLASMAATIEDEFENAWLSLYGSRLPAQGVRQRRLFYDAIARGVLRYLKQTEEAPSNEHFASSIRLQDSSLGGVGFKTFRLRNVDWNIDDV